MTEETVAATGPAEDSPLDETLASAPGSGGSGSELRSREIQRGSIIGRYVVLSTLGTGAMGIVLAAYDPELDRKVALKLLKPRGKRQEAARVRLLREAQALAKLSHPNVVAVHDVGMHQEQVFVAMEFIEGRTVAKWMVTEDERPRPWREVLRVFIAAGEGLSAAHAVGIVHRDFKPDNVMVGDDGRVRVMDFGLAREARLDEPSEPSGVEGPQAPTLTVAGALMGTPSYMSPEQFGYGEVTARSDQFGFCVALHEALYGARPFVGDTVAELVSVVSQGQRREPPRDGSVPDWLRAIVVRGLSVDPADRFESMSALLAALGSGESHRRGRRRIVIGLGVAAVGLGVWGGLAWDRARRARACAEAAAAVDEVWNPEARRALEAGIRATGVAYAEDVAAATPPWIDAQAGAWTEHAEAACVAAEIEQDWDEATYDRARWCLQDRRVQLEILVAELTEPSEQEVRHAVQSAAGLSPVSTCVDEHWLGSMAALPESDVRGRVEQTRRELSRVAYLEAAGHYDEGLELATQTRIEAEAIGWLPLVADARRWEAMLLTRKGSFAEAETVGTEAYLEAGRAEAWDVASMVASRLVFVVGYQGRRPSEGQLWAELSQMAADLAGDPLGLLDVEWMSNLAGSHFAAGQYDQAQALWDRVIARVREVLGPDHPLVARYMSNQAIALHARGDYAKALELWKESLAILEREMGPEHPAVASGLLNLGAVHVSLDQDAEAEAALLRALAIQTEVLGPEHPDVLRTLVNLGNALIGLGRPNDARQRLEHVLRIRQEVLGPDHPDVGVALDALGQAQRALGDYEAAVKTFSRACSITERTLGPEHPQLAVCLSNRGLVRLDLREPEAAKQDFERGIEVWKGTLSEDHPFMVEAHTGLGSALTALGQTEAGRAHLETALERSADEAVTPLVRAEAQLALARALGDDPRASEAQRRRARALAEQARADFREAGPAHVHRLDEIAQWLSSEAEPEPDAVTPSGDPRAR